MHPVGHVVLREERVSVVHHGGIAPVGHQHRVVNGGQDHQTLEDNCGGADWEDVGLLGVNLLLLAVFELDFLVVLSLTLLLHHVRAHVTGKIALTLILGRGSTNHEQTKESEKETHDDLHSGVAS